MLNYTDYLNRWNLYFAPHLPAGFPMPNYDEYVIREIQYFDFINLFICLFKQKLRGEHESKK